MKKIKEMIIPILVGFTLVASIYNTMQIRWNMSLMISMHERQVEEIDRLSANQLRIQKGLVLLLK